MTFPPSAFLASNTGFEYHGEENGKKKKRQQKRHFWKIMGKVISYHNEHFYSVSFNFVKQVRWANVGMIKWVPVGDTVIWNPLNDANWTVTMWFLAIKTFIHPDWYYFLCCLWYTPFCDLSFNFGSNRGIFKNCIQLFSISYLVNLIFLDMKWYQQADIHTATEILSMLLKNITVNKIERKK